MSHVRSKVSHVRCPVSHVKILLLLFGPSGGAIQWRVWYQDFVISCKPKTTPINKSEDNNFFFKVIVKFGGGLAKRQWIYHSTRRCVSPDSQTNTGQDFNSFGERGEGSLSKICIYIYLYFVNNDCEHCIIK